MYDRTRIKHLMWDRGWTQADLAEAIAYSQAAVSMMLCEHRTITERAAYLMSRAFEVPLSEIEQSKQVTAA